MRHEFAQVKRARAVMGHFGVHKAREHVVIAIAEDHAEIRGRADRPDLHPADVNQISCLWIRREVQIKFPVTRRGKDVGDSLARQRPTFLVHERFERSPGVIGVRRVDKTNLAVLRHMPAFGAVAAARRRRTLGVVELLPVLAQPGEMHAAGVGRDAEIGEWIDLGADFLRHLLKLDPIVA